MNVANSERLRFELITREDAELLYQLDNDPDVMRYINGGNVTSMEDIHQIFIPRFESYTNAEKGWGLWKVTINASDEFIGWILVRPMDYFSETPQFNNIELGWRFMKKSWGKGYATEAASAIKNALLQQTSIKYLSAIALAGNTDSVNIMKKLSMTYIKTGIHEDPLGDMEVLFYQLAVNE